MLKRKKDDGFTLIELMIVIAVIGILAVVLVPKMGSVKTSAKLGGVTTNLHSVQTAIQGATSLTNASSVSTFLTGAFAGDNVLKNPLTNSTSIATAVTASGATAPAVIVITTVAGADPVVTAADKGAVVVVPVLSLGTGTIKVYGVDDQGNLISNLTQTLSF